MRKVAKIRKNIFLFVMFMFFLFTGCSRELNYFKKDKENYISINIYYVKKDLQEIQSVKKNVYYDKEEDLHNAILKELTMTPDSGELTSSLPKNIKTNIERLGSQIRINLSKEYNEMKNEDRLYTLYCIVKTFTEVPGIQQVEVLVEGKSLAIQNGEPIGAIRKTDLVSLADISPNPQILQNIIIYFANKDGKLVADKKFIRAKEGEPIETYIIEELIKGPTKEGLQRTIPAEVNLKGKISVESGICYISFDKEFITKRLTGPKAEELAIYSIVNSLTELTNIDKVQFLIEGQREEQFGIQRNFNNPFERNEDLIQKVSTR